MKIRNLLMVFALALPGLGLWSCSDDGDVENPEFYNNLTLDKELVEMDPDGSTSVMVLDGNGSYTVVTDDDAVAEAEVTGNQITITATGSGKTYVRVKDDKGVQALVTVNIFGDLAVATTTNTVTRSYSSKGSVLNFPATYAITKGNGGYKASSENPAVTAVVEGTTLSVMVYGVVTDEKVTLTDRAGRSVEVTVTSTTNDYEPKFMALANETENCYAYRDVRAANSALTAAALGFFDGTTTLRTRKTSANGVVYVQYGYSYSTATTGTSIISGNNYFLVQLIYEQGVGVGSKTGARLQSYLPGTTTTLDRVTSLTNLNWLNVVKNDGQRIWVMFRHTNGSLGYFVQDIVK